MSQPDQPDDQSPATRSRPIKINSLCEIQGKCNPQVSHIGRSDSDISPSNRSENRHLNCDPRLSHKPSIRGLWRRGSVYQFRVRVPADLREKVQQDHVNRSLKTDSPSLAIRLSRKIEAEIDSMFENMRRDHGLPHDMRLLSDNSEARTALSTILARPSQNSAPTLPAMQPVNALSLAAVYERFLSDPTKRRSARTLLAHQTTCRVAKEVIGADTLITNINREHCRELLNILHFLPVNHSKKYPKLSVREAAEKAKADKSITTINTTNLNAYMARFATMLNWAVTEEYLTRNPAKGLQLAETVRPQDRRKPFDLWQLQKIFNAPIYTGCRDDQAGYASPGSVIAEGARYWVPLIGLMSGMRLNEICQLDVADVRMFDHIACFVVTAESLTESRDKSLKTRSSARIIPVHPKLLDLGFMAFVERKRQSREVKLFDDLPLGAKGFRSIAFSRWFTRFLQSAGATAPKTCFHSFRHGFRDAARNARIDRDIVLTLGGWVTGGGQSEAAEAYGKGFNVQVLRDAITAIEYPGLCLRHLKQS